MDGDDEVFAAAEQWLKWDQYPESKSVIEDLLKAAKANDQPKLDQLRKAFASRQVFGTAGIRGIMEPGSANMNDLVIVQTCQGLYDYVNGVFPDLNKRGIVVGHDARHNSRRWAHRTAAVFMHKGVPVYLFQEVVPTPFVAYSVALFKACCGVMVTASHNPKADNGYKVYWENSAQILSPHDKNIQKHINKNLEPWPNSWDLSIVENGGPLLHDPLPEVEKNYYQALKDSMLDIEGNKQTKVKFTFTPIHGVSQKMMERAFEHCGFPPFVSVPEQKDPNPDFPTAPFPNPEEGKTALDCAIRAADGSGSKYIIANDPDADRMAVAEKIDGSWRMFNGNETGCLLSYWIWHCFKAKNPNVDPKDVYMISTAVSSKFILALANKEGFNFAETLTGFKWMGNKAHELRKEGKHVLYAFEEAIGHMCMIPPLDKDGVSAAIKIAEFISHADRKEGKTLQQKLEDLYKTYGYHKATTSYYLSYDPAVTKKIFTRIRNFDNGKPFTYPTKLGNMPIKDVRDLTVGYDSTKPDKKPTLPVSSSTEMITFYLENGCLVTLRTSGTEPKIKYYMEMRAKPEETNWKAMDDVLLDVEKAIVDECLQPQINNLKPKIGS